MDRQAQRGIQGIIFMDKPYQQLRGHPLLMHSKTFSTNFKCQYIFVSFMKIFTVYSL